MKTTIVVVSILLLGVSCLSYASGIEAWIGGSAQLNSSLALGFVPNFSIEINKKVHFTYFFSIDKLQTWLGLEASLYNREFLIKQEKVLFWTGLGLGLSLSAREDQCKIDIGLAAHTLIFLSDNLRLELTAYGNTKPELLFRIGVSTLLLSHGGSF